VKRFVSLQILNLIDSQYDYLDGGSDRRKGSSSTGQWNHEISANIHAASGIPAHDPSIRMGEDRSTRVGNQNYIHDAKSISSASCFGILAARLLSKNLTSEIHGVLSMSVLYIRET
jgi:hypothetical protein